MLFITILGLGLFVRTWNLGRFGFFTDEIYHVIAARSIIDSGEPIFPNGKAYTRALPYTYLVAGVFKIYGISELTARLPSVLFGLALLVVLFLTVQKWFGWLPAIIGLTIMAFSPHIVELSRWCRMYSAFQLFYFVSLICFFIGFEPGSEKLNPHRKNNIIKWFQKRYELNLFYLVAFTIFFAISLKLHVLTLTLVPGILGYVFICFIVDLKQNGFSLALKTKYFLFLAMAALCGLVALIYDSTLFYRFTDYFSHMPIWLRDASFSYKYYIWFFLENYPSLFIVLPISALYIIKSAPKIGLYLVVSLLVPLTIFSFFSLKDQRYIAHLLAVFAIVVAPFIAFTLKKIYSGLQGELYTGSTLKRLTFLAVSVIAINVFTVPWIIDVRKKVNDIRWSDWKKFHQIYKKKFNDNSPIIATNQNLIYYYFGKPPQYYIKARYYDEIDDAEHFCGSTPLTSLTDIDNIVRGNSKVILLTNNYRFNSSTYFNDDMREYIIKNSKEVKTKGDTGIRMFVFDGKKGSEARRPDKELFNEIKERS
jgi:uncharacterized membrane protein